MTRFLCHELLYDFHIGRLDDLRRRAIEEHLKEHHDSRQELERLKSALSYCELLSSVGLENDLVEALCESRGTLESTLWKSSQAVREKIWRLMPPVLLATALTLGLVVVKPWRLLRDQPTTIAQINKKTLNPVVPIDVPLTVGLRQLDVISVVNPMPSPMIVSLFNPIEGKSKSQEIKVAQDEKPQKPVVQGALWRANISVVNFSATWPLIRDKIVELGGHVAGSVELGWLRRPNQSYFHFSLPESNQEALREFLSTFGPVRFSKQIHPRVMPEGKIRIILTVKDDLSNEPTIPDSETDSP